LLIVQTVQLVYLSHAAHDSVTDLHDCKDREEA